MVAMASGSFVTLETEGQVEYIALSNVLIHTVYSIFHVYIKLSFKNIWKYGVSSIANPPEPSAGTEPTLTQVREQVTLLSRCKRTGLNIKTGLLITKETIPMQT